MMNSHKTPPIRGQFTLANLLFMNFNMGAVDGAVQSIALTEIAGAVIATVTIF